MLRDQNHIDYVWSMMKLIVNTSKSDSLDELVRKYFGCIAAFDTINRSIECLNDNNVYLAFKYANEAMLLQREHTLQIKGVYPDLSEIRW